MFKQAIILFFLTLGLGKELPGASSMTILLPLLDSSHSYEHDLASILPETFRSKAATVQTDMIKPVHDPLQLMGIAEGQQMTVHTLAEGLHRLSKERRFAEGSLEILPISGDEFTFKLSLKGALVVDRVTLAGTLMGKDRYRQLYSLRSGMVFDQVEHAAGLMRIQEQLAAEGYYNATVGAVLTYDKKNCLVAIAINVQQNELFYVQSINVVVTAPATVKQHDKRTLERLIGKQLKQRLHGSAYQRDLLNRETARIRELLVDQGYSGNSIVLEERLNRTKGEVSLCLKISTGARKRYIFYGNKFFSRSQLLDQIRLFGASATLVPANFLADELIAQYKKYGFSKVAITCEGDAEQTFFVIVEGRRSLIRRISLRGVRSFSEAEMIAQHGKQLLTASYADDALIGQMLESLTQYYLAQGFWDVELLGSECRVTDTGTAELVITLSEGKQRFLKGVSLDGSFPCPVVLPRSCLPQPIPFDSAYIQQDKRLLLAALRKDGRLYASPVPVMIEEEDGIRVSWKCEGMIDQVAFGKMIIQSNHLDPAIIMREVEASEGMIWNVAKLDRTVARLKGLGIFDQVSLVPDDITRPELAKDLLLRCTIDTPYEARVRAGIQGVNRNIVKWDGGLSYRAGGSLLAKNPTGSGDLFRIDLDYSRYMHDVTLLYRIPWLYHIPLRTEFKLFSSRYDQPLFIGSPEVLYRTINAGFLMGVSNTYGSLTGGMQGGVAWQGLRAPTCSGCSDASCSRREGVARTLLLDPAFLHKLFPYFFVEPTIMFDVRDDKVNSHTGSLTLFALRAAVPYGVHHAAFVKFLLEQSCFIPVYDRTVVGIRMRLGTIVCAPFERILPAERFYLGGSHSLRGYNADYAPPLNSFTTCCGTRTLVPIGGKSMVNLNAEVRFPIYGPLGGIAFMDAGALSCGPVRTVTQPHTVMGAVGFGVRFDTAIGPLRFDIGWKVRRDHTVTGEQVDDKRYAWFLTLGQAF